MKIYIHTRCSHCGGVDPHCTFCDNNWKEFVSLGDLDTEKMEYVDAEGTVYRLQPLYPNISPDNPNQLINLTNQSPLQSTIIEYIDSQIATRQHLLDENPSAYNQAVLNTLKHVQLDLQDIFAQDGNNEMDKVPLFNTIEEAKKAADENYHFYQVIFKRYDGTYSLRHSFFPAWIGEKRLGSVAICQRFNEGDPGIVYSEWRYFENGS